VRHAPISQGADRILAPSAVTKGYEYAKDEYVALATDELKSLSPKTSTEMEITEFVHLSEIDPNYFETSYCVQPESAGEKPYALLYRSIKDIGLVALAQFAMHRREHVVVIRAGETGLIAHTMFFSAEVRKSEEYRTNLGLVNDKELGLANTLVRSLAAKFDATKFRDSHCEQLQTTEIQLALAAGL
jgi:DNA end-binding protein Ku